MCGSRARLAVAAVVITALVGCQKLSEDDGVTEPNEVSTVSAPAPTTGVGAGPAPGAEPAPFPASAPAPTPEPTSTPDPTSTPAPPPPPTAGSCSLPPSNPASPVCTDASSQLHAEVDAAQDAVTERYPELFDFNDTKCGDCYYVKDPRRYTDEVKKQLSRQGLCTAGNYEEIGVKSSNDFSEQYDIILASNHMRRDGSYRGVCRPAIF